jgi:hypothetical protein
MLGSPRFGTFFRVILGDCDFTCPLALLIPCPTLPTQLALQVESGLHPLLLP